MKPSTWLPVFLAGLLTGACQTSPPQAEDSPYTRIPAGSRLILNVPIELAPRRISFYLQHGEILDPPRAPMKYYPFCEVELHAFHDTPITLMPGEYRIDRVERFSSQFLASQPMLLASAGFIPSLAFGGGGGSDGDVGAILFARSLHLSSEHQSEPRTMTCGHLEDPWDGVHLTLNQIGEALGDVFTLAL